MESQQADVKEYSYFAEFLSKFVTRTNTLPAGDPLNPKTIIGPIITRGAVKVIDDRVKEAVARGAKAHTGAKYAMGGVRDSGWGRTGPRSLDDFSDLIWINSHSGQRQYPF